MADWPISPRLREYLEVQYELRRVLGEGGTGVVLLATERVLDRPVAIKVLHRHAAQQPEMRERFRREARVAARLTHANIVPLHTFGDIDGELFFVMGFVEGETLADRLKRDGRMPPDDALRILASVCDALALAHSQGVVHRDIKPENVLIEERTGRALLADFGIAREGGASAGLTGTGMAIGTPHYMSPEQAMSEGTVDHRADIYSVGVLGYRMLTGRLPFDGANVREILAQQMVATPKEFAQELPDIPSRAAAAVMRCLEKNASDRWSDAESLRQALSVSFDGNEDLPRELDDVEGTVPWMLAASVVGGWLTLLNRFYWHNEAFSDLLSPFLYAPVFAAVMLCGVVGWRHGLKRALAIAFRPPLFWTVWWPRFARRPGDVWDRLPRLLKWGRSIAFVSIVIGAPTVFTALLLMVTLPSLALAEFLASPVNKVFLRVITAAGFAGFFTGVGLLSYWWRKDGKRMIDGRPPWLVEPVASPRWKLPEFARILQTRQPTRSAPQSAAQLGSAISEQVHAMLRAGVVQSSAPADVAMDVVKAIADIDRELAMLEKGGDAAELKRLDDRIDAAAPGGLATDIVNMMTRQRDAVREIVRRQGEQRARRERLLTRLRELFVALNHLRSRASAANGDDVTGRVDQVCDDLRRLAAGYAELPTPPVRTG